MSFSANEVQALATKAARGGGAPAGQAMDFGRAAVGHLMADRPLEDLNKALATLPRGPILELPLAIATLLENADGTTAQGAIPCDLPLLALSYAEALPFWHEATATPTGITVMIDLTKPAPCPAVKRLSLPEDLLALMTTLAAQTFVPETDASRLAGAGAGLTDND